MGKRISMILNIVLTVMLASGWQAYAGNPNGPGTPPASTSSYTLEDIYSRLNAGTAGSQSTFTEPSVAPGTGTMHTLNDIMGKAPSVDDTNGATTANVASGKTFWGLTSGQWALQTGTAPPAGVPKTGQTTSYATGDDGDLERGVASPSPRFTDNSNGTVTDNLTGLIWLKNAHCTDNIGGVTFAGLGELNWQDALNFAAALQNGNCGLSDSSSAGDWRLPNLRELYSLIDLSQAGPPLPSGHPFTSPQSQNYWSSSTSVIVPTQSWYISGFDGKMNTANQTGLGHVWPVRGGQ